MARDRRTLPILPPMRCDDGCGDCCGVVPVSESDYEAVRAYARAHGITPVQQGVTCPLYQGGRCSVYPVRPLMCRVFGHVEGMSCSRGYNANVADDRVRAAVSRYQGTRVLHELLVEANPALTLDGALTVEARA